MQSVWKSELIRVDFGQKLVSFAVDIITFSAKERRLTGIVSRPS